MPLFVHASLDGEVMSGRGNATLHMQQEMEDFRVLTGCPIIAGSMNVKLLAPLLLHNDRARIIENTGRLLWRARLNGEDVWIYRFWDQPLHFVEIIASFHIRSRMGLQDGDLVSLTIDEADIASLAPKAYALWWIMWRYRENWAYTNDVYFSGTRRLARDLGITQKEGINSIPRSLLRFGVFVFGTIRKLLKGQ